MAGWWQEGHPACNHVPLIRNGSVPEQMEQEDSRGNQLTQVHVEKALLNKVVVVVVVVVVIERQTAI